MPERSGPSQPISILIADDHGVLRAGLRALLNAEPDMQVVGDVADGEAALSGVMEMQPDLLLADISMPRPTGIELARYLRSLAPGTRVLILTMHEDQTLLDEACEAGASGYLAKRVVESELVTAIRTIAAGGSYFNHMRQEPPCEGPSEATTTPATDGAVTSTELDVVRYFARGFTAQKTAEAIGTDPTTVESARASLRDKLGLRSRIDMIHFARSRGLLDE